MKIEPGVYRGHQKGKAVLLIVYGEYPDFMNVDMIQLNHNKNGAPLIVTDIKPKNLGVVFEELIENLKIEEE